jgi:exopolyphosphatase/guanosine-5'-triphosphate,3'-diphosphate pyrophosphatase
VTGRPARVAVVDFGTNSTRLLVADVEDGRVTELDRRSTVTRLGQGVDSSGLLAAEAIGRVLETVAGYRAAIDELGAGRTVAVATSAVRDAANREDLTTPLRERYGIEARTISGEEEARLTFLGATAPRAGSGRTMVLDIGGGSTEVVVGPAGGVPEFHVSTRAGSVRQTERHIHDDPPPADQLHALRTEVRAILEADVPRPVRDGVGRGVAVAGTATSLAAIDQALDPYDPARVDGYELRRDACERMLASLAATPLERRRQVAGLHPDRAPTIVAGAAILVEAMAAFDLGAMETSEPDLLHGAALTAAAEPGPA